jgi:ketosteroid isomerase-like protein
MERRDMMKGIGALATAGALGGTTMAQAETMSNRNLTLAESYLAAWQKKDLEGIGKHLHPDVHFKAPMSETTGKQAFLAASQRIFPILLSLAVRYSFASGDRVVAIYDFNCAAPIGVCRTAELITFQDGLISDVELFFDARPFAQLAKS